MDRLFRCCFCQRSFLIVAESDDVYHLQDGKLDEFPCDHCRVILKASKLARDNTVQVSCNHCGSQARVPFNKTVPGGYLNVFCSSCISGS